MYTFHPYSFLKYIRSSLENIYSTHRHNVVTIDIAHAKSSVFDFSFRTCNTNIVTYIFFFTGLSASLWIFIHYFWLKANLYLIFVLFLQWMLSWRILINQEMKMKTSSTYLFRPFTRFEYGDNFLFAENLEMSWGCLRIANIQSLLENI